MAVAAEADRVFIVGTSDANARTMVVINVTVRRYEKLLLSRMIVSYRGLNEVHRSYGCGFATGGQLVVGMCRLTYHSPPLWCRMSFFWQQRSMPLHLYGFVR
jgi:hypothetical protein